MSPTPSYALTRPSYVAQSHLVVVDLPRLIEFYRDRIGLEILERHESGALLGVAGRPLLTLSTDRTARPAPSTAAGLFHTAFLLPSRSDLAHWLHHAVACGLVLEGASDHLVSEALYLSDPEGNGIEIYADRAVQDWHFQPDGTVSMATERLNLKALYESAPERAWSGMPAGTAIGHIHLQVGDIPEADAFYRDVLGLKLMARYPGASFFASGAYHHHVAANIWNSRGARRREAGMTGLADYRLAFNDEAELARALARLDSMAIATERRDTGIFLRDPWGIGLTLSAQAEL